MEYCGMYMKQGGGIITLAKENCIMRSFITVGYSSPNIARMNKSRRMTNRPICRILWKPEGKGPLGRPRDRWKVNVEE
jgi:hypothetical protein